MNIYKIYNYIILIIIAPYVWSYELITHAGITDNAFSRSLLSTTAILRDLDIKPDVGIGSECYDVIGARIEIRLEDEFENTSIKDSFATDPISIAGWLMRGAIREDDVLAFDDPYPQIRVLNHFYDPLHNRPLTVLIGLGEKAPDWAMGSADIFAQPNTPDPNRDNHYAWFDAREAMYRALTSRSSAGSLAIHPDGTGGAREPTDGSEVDAMRKAYWATTFRSLGDVLHLVEDMAQANGISHRSTC